MATAGEIEAAHLLRRTGFGASTADVAVLAPMTRAQRVDWVMDFSGNTPAIHPPYVMNANDPTQVDSYASFIVMRRWWLDRMATVARPFHEKMTLFWHGHLTTSFWKVGDIESIMDQNDTFRANAFGSFNTLVQLVSLGSAMIQYLDNDSNYAGHPNENFARELMELFTLGVDNGYVQADVLAMARAWTGHNLQYPQSGGPPVYHFYSGNHDTGLKSIFGLPAQNWDGPPLLAQLINGVRKAQCALHIARRLWTFLAGPPTVDLTPFANAFAADNMNISTLVRSILLSDAFYTDQVRHSLVRPPIDWGVSLLRATGRDCTQTDMDYHLSDLGQGVLEPPTVAGWKINNIWISENAEWEKSDGATRVADQAVTAGFLSGLETTPVATAVDIALDALGTPAWSVSAGTKTALANFLSAERAVNGTRQRRNIIRLISLSPEFQLA